MTQSTSRGLLYTAPPAADDERTESTAERAESTVERTTPTVEHSNHGHAAADD